MSPEQAKREVKQILLEGRAMGLSARTIAKAVTLWSKKTKVALPAGVFDWLGEDDRRFRLGHQRTFH